MCCAACQPLGLAGVKVVGDFRRQLQEGLPSEMALLNCSARRRHPVAIIDATAITDMSHRRRHRDRCAPSRAQESPCSAISARRWTAYWNVRLLAQLFKSTRFRVHSRARKPGRLRGAAQQGSAGRAPGRFLAGVRRGRLHLVEASRLTSPSRVRPRGSRRARWSCPTHDERDRARLADIMDNGDG